MRAFEPPGEAFANRLSHTASRYGHQMIVAHEGLLEIGQVDDRVGLSLRTVRYSDDVGLSSTRTEGGFRRYAGADVAARREFR